MGCTAIRRMSRAFVTRYWTSRSRPLVAMRPCLCSGHARHSSHICSASREARPTHDLPPIPSLPRRRQLLLLLFADGGGDAHDELGGSFIRPVQAAVILCLSDCPAKTIFCALPPYQKEFGDHSPFGRVISLRLIFYGTTSRTRKPRSSRRITSIAIATPTLAAYSWAWQSRHLPY